MNLIFIRTPNQTDGETFDDSKLTINQKAQNTMIKALQSSRKQERFKQRQNTAAQLYLAGPN